MLCLLRSSLCWLVLAVPYLIYNVTKVPAVYEYVPIYILPLFSLHRITQRLIYAASLNIFPITLLFLSDYRFYSFGNIPVVLEKQTIIVTDKLPAKYVAKHQHRCGHTHIQTYTENWSIQRAITNDVLRSQLFQHNTWPHQLARKLWSREMNQFHCR